MSAPRIGPDARSQSIGGPACRNCPRSRPERLATPGVRRPAGASAREHPRERGAVRRPRAAGRRRTRARSSSAPVERRPPVDLGHRRRPGRAGRRRTVDAPAVTTARVVREQAGDGASPASDLAAQADAPCARPRRWTGGPTRRRRAAPRPGGRGPAGRRGAARATRPRPAAAGPARVAERRAMAGASSRGGVGVGAVARARRRAAARRVAGRAASAASRSSRGSGVDHRVRPARRQAVVAEVDHRCARSAAQVVGQAPSSGSSGMLERDRAERPRPR